MQDGGNMIDMPAMDDHESTNMIGTGGGGSTSTDTDLKAKVAARPGVGSNRPTSTMGHSGGAGVGSRWSVVGTVAMVATASIVIGLN